MKRRITSSHRGWRLTAAPPRASSCWPPGPARGGQQQPARHRGGQLPPRHRAHPRHPGRGRGGSRDRRHRVRGLRPGRGRQRRIGHQAGRQRGEHRPDLLRPPGERPQPAPHRRGRTAQPLRDHPVPGPRRLRLQRPPDHRRGIRPPGQAPRRKQHMRRPALPAPRPARDQHHVPVLLSVLLARQPHSPRDPVSPPGQHAPARRAGQLPVPQLPLDHVPVSVYREHDASARQPSGPPVSGCQDEEAEGRAHVRRDHRAVAHEKGQPEGCPRTPSSP